MAGDVVGDQVAEHRLGLMDISVRRNAYGRQVDSFEAPLEVEGLEEPFTAVFIRAPVVERVGSKVEVLASHDGLPSTGSTRSPSCVFVSSGDNQRPATARVVPGYGVAVSGHSKWATIKRKKGANDAQRAKVLGKASEVRGSRCSRRCRQHRCQPDAGYCCSESQGGVRPKRQHRACDQTRYRRASRRLLRGSVVLGIWTWWRCRSR
jgi:hypothetical protein